MDCTTMQIREKKGENRWRKLREGEDTWVGRLEAGMGEERRGEGRRKGEGFVRDFHDRRRTGKRRVVWRRETLRGSSFMAKVQRKEKLAREERGICKGQKGTEGERGEGFLKREWKEKT